MKVFHLTFFANGFISLLGSKVVLILVFQNRR